MSRIRITHTTRYCYSERVAFGLHRLVVRPREGHDLQVEALDLRIKPASRVTWHRDVFGNSIAMVQFLEPSAELEICAEITVFRRDHSSHPGLFAQLPVTLPVHYSAVETPVVNGYIATVFPGESDDLRAWVTETFSPHEGRDAVHLVQEMTTWIWQTIRYRRREDRGVQSPMETLGSRSGSCRDMATLLLEALRTLKLASRFASGYLDSIASAAGRAATHAWTEVYFPEHGWFGCDPTLGEDTSQKHIVTGVSAHPRGVMPVSGTYSAERRDAYVGMTVSVKLDHLARQPDSL